MRRALFIMAKEPVPGKVKTRLCPPLTYLQAAEFYRCFLSDVFACAQKLKQEETLDPLDLFVAYHPPESEETFRAWAPESFQFFPQEGAGLSERLINGFSRLFSEGYTTVAVLGSDSPTLPAADLTAGFLCLEKKEENLSLVIKPCRDGGYCFLAMKEFYPQVFTGIDWSTARVLKQTLQKAKALGIKSRCLSPWYDIDTVNDFEFLREPAKAGEDVEGLWSAGKNTLEFYKTHLQPYVEKV